MGIKRTFTYDVAIVLLAALMAPVVAFAFAMSIDSSLGLIMGSLLGLLLATWLILNQVLKPRLLRRSWKRFAALHGYRLDDPKAPGTTPKLVGRVDGHVVKVEIESYSHASSTGGSTSALRTVVSLIHERDGKLVGKTERGGAISSERTLRSMIDSISHDPTSGSI